MSKNLHYIDEKVFLEDPLLHQIEGLGWQMLRLKNRIYAVEHVRDFLTGSPNGVFQPCSTGYAPEKTQKRTEKPSFGLPAKNPEHAIIELIPKNKWETL